VVTIRPYSDAADRPALLALWTEVLGYTSGHNEPNFALNQKLAAADGLLWVAVTGDRLAGTIMAGYDGHRGWIYSLAVHPECRGRGIGTLLLETAEKALVDRGCAKINLQIRDTNAGVAAFYEKHGFAREPLLSMGKRLVTDTPRSPGAT
jgi:ribosomal protein S18 acetylase RimI-like enzyme